MEALLDAETEGYKTGLDRQALTDALLAGLNRRMPAAASDSTGMRKNELLSLVGLLRKLDARIDYPRYCAFIASIPTRRSATGSGRRKCCNSSPLMGCPPRIRCWLLPPEP